MRQGIITSLALQYSQASLHLKFPVFTAKFATLELAILFLPFGLKNQVTKNDEQYSITVESMQSFSKYFLDKICNLENFNNPNKYVCIGGSVLRIVLCD